MTDIFICKYVKQIVNVPQLKPNSICFQIIDKDINPYVEQWEAQGSFPAREVFKKLGDAGLLGITKPVGRFGIYKIYVILSNLIL